MVELGSPRILLMPQFLSKNFIIVIANQVLVDALPLAKLIIKRGG